MTSSQLNISKRIKNTDLAIGIKETPPILLDISNYLLSIHEFLNEGKVVFIEGNNESGKSTICSELCYEKTNSTFSLFFDKYQKGDFNLNFVFECLIPQMMNCLEEEDNEEPFTQVTFSRLHNKLRRNRKEKYLFIIDGLEHCRDDGFTNELFDLLSINVENFKFVISGGTNSSYLKDVRFHRFGTNKLRIIGFGITEVSRFFKGVVQSDHDLKELHLLSKGNPSKLTILKQLLSKNNDLSVLKDNITFEIIINNDLENNFLESFLENEIDVEMLIALVAFSDNLFTKEDLSIAFCVEETKFDLILSSDYFKIENGNRISFTSEIYKDLFKKRYYAYRSEAEKLEYKIYYEQSNVDYKIKLIQKLHENRNHSDILKEFRSNFLFVALNEKQNVRIVNDLIQVVCRASLETESYEDLFNYSLQGTVINEIEKSFEYENRILSLIAINQFEEALLLADLQISKVQKLFYFAKIARKQKDLLKKIDSIVIDKIDSIFSEIDLSDYGRNLYEIISDLISISSKYAVEILNKNTDDNNQSDNINNILFARISLAALSREEDEKEEKYSEMLSRFDKSKTGAINTALQILIGKYTFENILAEVSNYEESKDRLKLLRYWLKNTSSYDHIDIIIEKTLDEILNLNNNNFFNLEVLAEVTESLCKIPVFEKRYKLVKKVQELSENLEDKGLFLSKTKFRLNIFNALYDLESIIPDAIKIIEEMLLEIIEHDDLLVRAESLSFTLEYLYPKSNYVGPIKGRVSALFMENFQLLLLNVSDQFSSIRQILRSVAKMNLDFSEEIIVMLNTSINRDKARFLVIEEYLEKDILKINLDRLFQFQDNFDEQYFIDVTSQFILEKFSTLQDLKEFHLHKMIAIEKNLSVSKLSQFAKIQNKILLLKILMQHGKSKFITLINSIKREMLKNIGEMEDSYRKLQTCQFLSSIISSFDIAFAKNIIQEADSQQIQFFSNVRNKTTLIAIFAFEATVKLDGTSNISPMFESLIKSIDSINSIDDKLELFTHLGFICHLNKLAPETEKLSNLIFDLLTEVIEYESAHNYTKTLTFIYLTNSLFIQSIIETLPYLSKEDVFDNLCNYYLYKNSPYEVYDYEQRNFDCSYNDIVACLEVLDLMSYDVNIYNLIVRLSKLSETKSIKLSTIQINNINTKVNNIIASKFPDLRNIAHIGYAIASKARFQKMYKKYDLKMLLEETNNIPNISDRAYVKSIILDEFSNFKCRDITKNEIFCEIVDDLNSVGNNYEFVTRVNDISETMLKAKREEWKKILENAFNFSRDFENEYESTKHQKELIDTLYKCDENLAKEFVEKGEELAQKKTNEFLKQHFKNLKEVSGFDKFESKKDQELININKENFLQGLYRNIKSVNSKRIKARKISELKSILLIGSRYTLQDSILVFSSYFKNLSSATYSINDRNKIINLIVSNFNSVINSTTIIDTLLKRPNISGLNNIKKNDSGNFIISPKDRKEAFSIIKDWIVNEADDMIIIIEPYFEKEDLDLLNLIYQCDKSLPVKVLACDYIEQDDLQTEWKKYSKEDMSDCEFIFTKYKNGGDKPLHDRYILSKNTGLRIGTSINSIGYSKKFAEISKMNKDEISTLKEDEIDGFINGSLLNINGLKLDRKTYRL